MEILVTEMRSLRYSLIRVVKASLRQAETRARKTSPWRGARGAFSCAPSFIKLFKFPSNPSQAFFLDANSNTPLAPLKGGISGERT